MEAYKCRCRDGYKGILQTKKDYHQTLNFVFTSFKYFPKGHDCNQRADSEFGYWEVLTPKSPIPKGVASHSAIVHNHSLWIIGGTNLNLDMKKPPIYRYDFKRKYGIFVLHELIVDI